MLKTDCIEMTSIKWHFFFIVLITFWFRISLWKILRLSFNSIYFGVALIQPDKSIWFVCAPNVSYGTYKSCMVWPFKIRSFFFSPSFKIIILDNVYCLLKNNYSWVYLVRFHYVYNSLRLVVPFINYLPPYL